MSIDALIQLGIVSVGLNATQTDTVHKRRAAAGSGLLRPCSRAGGAQLLHRLPTRRRSRAGAQSVFRLAFARQLPALLYGKRFS